MKASSATSFPAVLGFVSYYDQSKVNARIGLLLTPYAWLIMLGPTSLAALGFWLRLPAGVREAWTAIPLSLMAVAFVTAGRGNYLVLVRSAQMVMAHVWLGLTLLAFARRTTFGAVRWRLPFPGTRIVGRAATRLVWAVVLSLDAAGSSWPSGAPVLRGVDVRIHIFSDRGLRLSRPASIPA